MIFDIIKNRHLYTFVSKDIRTALDYLAETDFMPMPAGIYTLDGENFNLLVQEYNSVTKEQSLWECHRKHIDIQFIVSGMEQMGFKNIYDMKEISKYNPDKDVTFLEGDGDYVTVSKDSFAIFFPEDVHRPKIAVADKIGKIKKVVIKIPYTV